MCNLDLQLHTQIAFEFLESEFGFSRSYAGPERVTYAALNMEVHVLFDLQRSFELNVTIALDDETTMPPGEPPFSLGEVLRTLDAPEAARLGHVQVSNQPTLESFLDAMASALRKHGSGLLRGDATVFRALALNRSTECKAYEDERELAHQRGLANHAWEKRDFDAVVTALSSLKLELLTESEKKRLDIARRRQRED